MGVTRRLGAVPVQLRGLVPARLPAQAPVLAPVQVQAPDQVLALAREAAPAAMDATRRHLQAAPEADLAPVQVQVQAQGADLQVAQLPVRRDRRCW